ncbi:MAG: succinate dehydrogenase, hydrophobic membrane anchor protein [Pseudohongiellaceae bacterium]
MVINATSLSRSGLSDWLIQRVSAVILGAYMLFVLGSFIAYPDMDYAQWRSLFGSNVMRIFSLIALLALCGHAWVGMWTIGTDYLTAAHLGKGATGVRLAYQAVCVLLILVYLIWGIRIFWGS